MYPLIFYTFIKTEIYYFATVFLSISNSAIDSILINKLPWFMPANPVS